MRTLKKNHNKIVVFGYMNLMNLDQLINHRQRIKTAISRIRTQANSNHAQCWSLFSGRHCHCHCSFGSRPSFPDESSKAPEINLGYFTQVFAIWKLLIKNILWTVFHIIGQTQPAVFVFEIATSYEFPSIKLPCQQDQ